ncbi:Ig-like domain-containing protein [Mycobacterium sp. MMS18-G62]
MSAVSGDGVAETSSIVSGHDGPAVVVRASGGAHTSGQDDSVHVRTGSDEAHTSSGAADSVAANKKSNAESSAHAQLSAAAVTAPVDSQPHAAATFATTAPQVLSASVPIDPDEASQQWVSKTIADFMSGAQNWISSLPVGPDVKELLDGVLYFVRRTFLNQDPSVAPVQISGQISGPVKGSVGAVDVEGDPIVYRVTKAPQSGSVEVNSDGTYTYTPGAGFNGVDNFTVTADDPGLHVNLLDLFDPGTRAKTLVNQGAIKFQFIYNTGADLWTADARNSMQAAANQLAAYFMVTSPVTLTYNLVGKANEGFAAASSPFIADTPGYHRTVVQNKLLTGADSNGTAADGEIDINFGKPWAFGVDVGSEQYDFTATVMHELLHTFNFNSSVDKAGENGGGNWSVFDSFIVTSNGSKPIGVDGDAFEWNTAYDPNLTGGNGGLYFGGANAVAAYNNKLVPLFTPNPWDAGSSVTHLDDSTFTGSNQKMMNAYTPTGLGIRVLSPIEVGIMKDLGYTVMVPQPQTPSYAFALVGVIFLRRRKSSRVQMDASAKNFE